jgi:hypothetical protein
VVDFNVEDASIPFSSCNDWAPQLLREYASLKEAKK